MYRNKYREMIMTLTASNMMPLGTVAPEFTLIDTKTNTKKSLNEMKSNLATVIMFICNHCPFVKHVQKELINLANDYQKKGISFIAISSNDIVNYPEDGPSKMKEIAEKFQYPFPYLYDESQQVAKNYQAACTPDFYVFDNNMQCIYRGQLDDSRPGNNISVTGKDLRNALDNVLTGKPIASVQKPSMGCNIKWK